MWDKKINLKVRRNDLKKFFIYAEKHDIKFLGKVEIYSTSVYFGNNHTNLCWDAERDTDIVLRIIIKLLNTIIINYNLVYSK